MLETLKEKVKRLSGFYKRKFVHDTDLLIKGGEPFSESDYRMERWEWDRLLRTNNVYTLEEFKIWRNELDLQFIKCESNWFQKLVGQLWYKIVLPKSQEYLTPKKLVWILTHLDQLLPWMPSELCKKILLQLDKIAEFVYTKME